MGMILWIPGVYLQRKNYCPMTTLLVLFLSVIVGVAILLIWKPEKSGIKILLTFSGGYLLSITLLHLFPEVYGHAHGNVGIWVVAGLIFQLVLDFFSHGIDHGHHGDTSLESFPWAIFITLSLHSFMEGLPLSDHRHSYLLWAIVVHKVPVSMMLAAFFFQSKVGWWKAALFIIMFALMSPLGSLVSQYTETVGRYAVQINAWVAGAFLHIATVILFESSKEHRFNIMKFTALLAGIGLAVSAL